MGGATEGGGSEDGGDGVCWGCFFAVLQLRLAASFKGDFLPDQNGVLLAVGFVVAGTIAFESVLETSPGLVRRAGWWILGSTLLL